MDSATQKILQAAGAPLDAAAYMIFDQSAHLDYDWQQEFLAYYNDYDSPARPGVKKVYPQALQLMQKNSSYCYSLCEMDYFRQYLTDNPDRVADFQAVVRQLMLAGGGITSPDSLLPHGEAFIRNYLAGRMWLQNTISGLLPIRVCWIPDDFGHDPELPATLTALGMTAVSFSRVPGNATAAPTPTLMSQMYQQGLDFYWQASDQSSIFAHFLQGGYAQGSGISGANGPITNIQSYIDSYSLWEGNPEPCGAPTPYLYVPLDNDFHAPVPDLLNDLEQWNTSSLGYLATGVYAVALPFAAFAELVQLYDAENSVLNSVQWDGRPYWTGHYMSRPALKIMHYDVARTLLCAESLALMAELGGAVDGPVGDSLLAAWDEFMPSTHHDYINGTAVDAVYQAEQMTELAASTGTAQVLLATAAAALAGAVGTSPQDDETPVVVANSLGVQYGGVVELASPPAGVAGMRFGDSVGPVQTSADGGLLFLADVAPVGWTTGYLTPEQGSGGPYLALDGDGTYYTFSNGYLTATISQAAPYYWGISSFQDADGGYVLDTSSGPGNNVVVYQDGGDIYEFGYEYVNSEYEEYNVFNALTPDSVAAGAASVTESGPLRVTVQVPLELTLPNSLGTLSATLEYSLVAGEPFLRMSITGAAPSGTSVTVQFPLQATVDSMWNGTPNHWTSQQGAAIDGWSNPIFHPTHRFVLPQASGSTLAAIYHPEVPAWAWDGSTLIGCVLRNTPGGPHGAVGTDDASHTLRYALRPVLDLGGPTTAQPLAESLCYAWPPVAVVQESTSAILTESGSVAQVASGTGAIMAAKPGDVTPGTTVLRLYQPTNGAETLTIQLPSAPQSAMAVTALEDPIEDGGPSLSLEGSVLTVTLPNALATVQITW